ncbi:MAG TPA: DNA polymerase [Nitrospinota bacterium]|nr:DNA polymerase [Nitrospinota bacterium]
MNSESAGGAAEVLLTALAKSEDYFKNIDIKLINIIHDEIILEVGEKEVSRASSALKEVMTESFLMLFPNSSATKLVEIKTGSNWADTR